MATVASTIKMYDNMTRVLKGITGSLHLSLSAMEEMQNTMDKTFNNKAIEAAKRSIQNTEIAIKDLIAPIESAEKKQERFNRELRRGEDFAGGLASKIIGFVGAYVGYRTIKGFMSNALDAANEQIRAEQRLQSIMANINGMTQDGIDLVKKQAYELEKMTSISAATGMFGQSQLAQYVYDPHNINALSEAMYNLATETYGVAVTQEQISQTADLIGKAMMGQIDALSRNGFKLSAILEEAEIELFKYGTEAERTAIMLEVLNENQENFARQMSQTPEGQILKLQNAFGDLKTTIGYGVIPMIMLFSSYVQENMPMIENVFVTVFSNIINLLTNVFKVGVETANFLIENWSTVGPIFWGVAAAVTALAVAQALYNAALNVNPFVLIISVVVGLIVWLVKLWQTNDKVAAGIMRAWNSFWNFMDKISIYIAKIDMAIGSWLDSMKIKTLTVLQDMINGVIDGINWLIDKLNKIPGVSIDAITTLDFVAGKQLEAEARRQASEDAIKRLEENAVLKAAEREQKVLDMMENRAAKRAEEDAKRAEMFSQPDLVGMLNRGNWQIDDIGEVGEVGKIRDTVDISSEDLKIMRELAEMKSIQNFVTLTPTVSVLHTGDINNGYDIDTIVARIEDNLENQIASSAQGVYGG